MLMRLERKKMKNVLAYLNHGRWKVNCPKCGDAGAVLAENAPEVSPYWTRGNRYVCPSCYPGSIATYQTLYKKHVVTLPDEAERAKAWRAAELAGDVYRVTFPRNVAEIKRITNGWQERFINWKPGQTMESLAASPQHNSYITPITFVALQTLTAAQMNGIQANITEMGLIFGAAGNVPYAASTSTLGVVAKVTGAILYFTSSILSALAPGTQYNVLSQGAASTPSWATLATLIANQAVIASQAAGDWLYAASATALGRQAGTAYGIPRNNAAGTGADATAFRQCEATRARRGSGYSSTSISETAIPLTAEAFDDSGWHDNVTNSERIAPTSDGRYRSFGGLSISNSSGATIDSMTVYIKLSDGSTIATSTISGLVDGGTYYFSLAGKLAPSLTAGEYFTLTTARSNGTSGITINTTDTWLEVERAR